MLYRHRFFRPSAASVRNMLDLLLRPLCCSAQLDFSSMLPLRSGRYLSTFTR